MIGCDASGALATRDPVAGTTGEVPAGGVSAPDSVQGQVGNERSEPRPCHRPYRPELGRIFATIGLGAPEISQRSSPGPQARRVRRRVRPSRGTMVRRWGTSVRSFGGFEAETSHQSSPPRPLVPTRARFRQFGPLAEGGGGLLARTTGSTLAAMTPLRGFAADSACQSYELAATGSRALAAYAERLAWNLPAVRHRVVLGWGRSLRLFGLGAPEISQRSAPARWSFPAHGGSIVEWSEFQWPFCARVGRVADCSREAASFPAKKMPEVAIIAANGRSQATAVATDGRRAGSPSA